MYEMNEFLRKYLGCYLQHIFRSTEPALTYDMEVAMLANQSMC